MTTPGAKHVPQENMMCIQHKLDIHLQNQQTGMQAQGGLVDSYFDKGALHADSRITDPELFIVLYALVRHSYSSARP